MISIAGNRRVALILSVLFISAQLLIPVTYAGDYTKITGVMALDDKQSVSPNPEIYPEFYNQGSGQADNKMMLTQEPSLPFAGEKESVASKENAPSAGKVERVIVIPIQFADAQFGPDHTKAYFEGIMNQMKDYYEKNSGYIPASKGMAIDFTVAPVVTSTETLAYYGADGTGRGSDDASGHQIYELAREAAILANPSIDFNQFDTDSDPNHIVDHLFIIHAGNGQENSKAPNDIWSHRWSIKGGQLLDGVYAYNYACVPESGTLGVFAHEFGHDIGLPDLYDSDEGENGYTLGVGDWDIMGSGSWNKMPGAAAGTCPANLSAWSKEFLGWNTVTSITSDGTYTLTNSDMNNSAYRFWTNGDTSGDEYYLSEYRRKNGYDAALPGEGVLIWHVDRKWLNTVISGTKSVLTSNNVNSYSNRLGVELEQADGKRDMYWNRNGGDANDPFPGATPSMAFTNIPYGMNYYNYDNSKFNYIDVSNFQVSGSSAAAFYRVSERPPAQGPILNAPADGSIIGAQPKFLWDIVPQSTSYRVQLAADNGFANILKDIYMTRFSPLLVYENGRYSYTLPDDQKLEYPKTYYWRVAGLNESSNEANTQWSITRSFNTRNNWERKADLPAARANFAAVEFNGEIYAFGGYTSESTSTTSVAEVFVYNPQNDGWTPKKNMPVPRQIQNAVTFNNKIYLAGGHSPIISYNTLLEVYDPLVDEWSTLKPLPDLGGKLSLCAANGKMYLISINGTDEKDCIQEYDPADDSWKVLTSRSSVSANMTLTASINGLIYTINGDGKISVYDPATNNWQDSGYKFSIPGTNGYKTAVLNNELYILYSGSDNCFRLSYKYNTVNHSILQVASVPEVMNDPGVVVANGSIYLLGGFNSAGIAGKIVEKYISQSTLPDPAILFSFNGQNEGKLINMTSNMEYSLDGGNSYTAANSPDQVLTTAEINSITAGNDIRVRFTGTSGTSPGAIQIIDILANNTPVNVVGNDSTNTVAGMLNTMEYCTDGIHWIKYNGSLPDLSGNITFKVRYAAAGLSMAGAITAISFTASSTVNSPPGGGSYGGTLPGGDGGNNLPATPVTPVVPVVPAVITPSAIATSTAITVMTFGDTELGRQIDDPNSRTVTARVTSSAIQEIRLDTAAFKEIVQAGKSLMIDSPKVDITFPTGAVSLPMLTSAGADSKFEVKIEQINPGSAAQKLGDAAKNDGKGLFAIAGCLFEFSTQIVSGNKIQIVSGFNAPITVTVTLKGTEPGIADTDKLGVYYYNETSHTWEYMGGAYNAATHSITFTTPHLSLYSVMINEITFSDIKTHWAKADIEKLAARQITTGVGGGKFNPEGTVTRAEFISWLVRGLELSKTEGQSTKMKSSAAPIPFKDVPGSKWYSDEISLAYRSGITGDNVSFRPDDRITREEMAYMIAGALKFKGRSANLDEKQTEQQLKEFKDSNRIQAGMRQSVAEAVKLGIITGRPGKIFAPGANATRAEGITMIRRLLSNLQA
jgi:M6 family metalloprotease-like protein